MSRKRINDRGTKRCRHPTGDKPQNPMRNAAAFAAAVMVLAVSGTVAFPAAARAGDSLIHTKNSHYRIALELEGSGMDLSTGTYTLKADNTYYIEIAGGAGKDDSWVIDAGQAAERRTDTNGGRGGYQCLKVTPAEDITLVLYAGGKGRWVDVNSALGLGVDGAGSPDGQAGGGGGSSSVWLKEETGARQKILLAAAGGGGGATGGTSNVVGHDGGSGYGTNEETHGRIYTEFAAAQGGQNGRTWEGWEESSRTGSWRQIIWEDINLYDGGNEQETGQDRLPSWDSSMDLESFYARYLPHKGIGSISGGGGGFPAGTCSYYVWTGWLIGNSGWEWVESSRRSSTHATGTGGYGYTMDLQTASEEYGIEMISEAADGNNDGEGYVRIWEEQYALTADPNGGIFRSSYNPTVMMGRYRDRITVEDPVREGYRFAGWAGAQDGGAEANWDSASREFTFLRRDEDWQAQWTPISYTITYDLRGGSLPAGQTNPDSYTVESGPITLHNPMKEGYLFLGWTGSNGSAPSLLVEIPEHSTGDRTYTANWQPLATVGLTAVPNLSYKSYSVTDGAGRTYTLAKGGVDLNWRSTSQSLSITDGRYRFQVLYYDDRDVPTKEGESTTATSAAFNSGTPGKNYVYDKAAPEKPSGSYVRVSGDQVEVTWHPSADRGTAYAFRVDVGYTASYLPPWQQILYQALLDEGRQPSSAYTAVSGVKNIVEILSNNTYMYYIYRSPHARNLLASYYKTACNTYIDQDSSYNDYYNRVNYAIGCQAYLWRDGQPTAIWSPGIPTADGGTCGLDGRYEVGMYSVSSNLSKASAYTKNSGICFDLFYSVNDPNPDRMYHTVVPVIQKNGSYILVSDNQYHYAASQINAAIDYTNYKGGTLELLCRNQKSTSRGYVTAGMSPSRTALTNNLYNTIAKDDPTRSPERMFASGSSVSVPYTGEMGWRQIALPGGYTAGYLKFRIFLTDLSISRIKLAPAAAAVTADTTAVQGSEKAEYASNVARTTVTTGVYGYLCLADTSPDTEIRSWSDGIFTAHTSITVPRIERPQYLHIAAVDHAGNIGPTHTVAIAGPENPETVEYTVHFDGNGATGGEMPDQMMRLDEPEALPENVYVKTGYVFDGWNTEKDGSGISYEDKEIVVNISPGLPEINHTEVTLYARWKPIVYTIRYHANNGTDAYTDRTAVYDQMTQILSASTFPYENHRMIGWGKEAEAGGGNLAGAVVYVPGQTVGNLTDQEGAVIHLYAIWLDERVTITGALSNVRRPSAETFRNGETVDLSLIASGWPVEVTVEFPEAWNQDRQQSGGGPLDISYSYEGDHYAEQENYYFTVPMDELCAAAGESYRLILHAVNVYGNTDSCELWLTVDEMGSITGEIRTRLK